MEKCKIRSMMDVINDEKLFVDSDLKVRYEIHKIKGKRDLHQIRHFHSSLEISMVESGSGMYYINGKVYPFTMGDIFVINNVEEHGIVLKEDEQMVNVVIHFEPRFIWNDDNFSRRFLKIFNDREDDFNHKFSGDSLEVKMIRDLIIDLNNEFENKLPEYSLMVKVKILNILALMLRAKNYDQSNESKSFKKHEMKVIDDVLDYIEFHFTEEISLDELSKMAYMTPTYFSSFFKKLNGVSPKVYVIRKRIEKAMEDLTTSDDTVLCISHNCGFKNSANFNRQFKKLIGMTPSQYRNATRQ
ncbi:helix-turn-helix domain-containing protein [Acidaminobacter sp. JC074]|uniref:helix-turn-helix domain-containing protein n=1 Tax=Acidaminobacter sp. JC074 TaxID=2530199 RepID=UPI001F0F4A4A|nr:AraC family transcriptional regulator [Acidaminobacter sp. JC074]MCH4886854.1 helix-turn-helix domain-containing protein [Acidaminobacter sp. JC074]